MRLAPLMMRGHFLTRKSIGLAILDPRIPTSKISLQSANPWNSSKISVPTTTMTQKWGRSSMRIWSITFFPLTRSFFLNINRKLRVKSSHWRQGLTGSTLMRPLLDHKHPKPHCLAWWWQIGHLLMRIKNKLNRRSSLKNSRRRLRSSLMSSRMTTGTTSSTSG